MRIRGISPVVATALLVLIAIATAAILYLWVSGAASSQLGGEEVLYERIKIDAVQYDSNDQKVTIYVHNIGEIPTNVAAAYVINATGTVVAQNTNINVKIDPGDIRTVEISNANLKAGVYTVKVVTLNGVEATYTLVVRQV
jgi:flagellin-like protein